MPGVGGDESEIDVTVKEAEATDSKESKEATADTAVKTCVQSCLHAFVLGCVQACV